MFESVCDVSILMLSTVHLITHHLFLQASNSATPLFLSFFIFTSSLSHPFSFNLSTVD